jgi:Uma2 family endonuclease
MSTATAPATPIRPASADIPTMPIYRLSVKQYEAMARHGILKPADRVELIHGWLVPKMTKNTPHAMATGLTQDSLDAHRPAGWHVRNQDPVTLTDSVPEPDLAVVRGTRRDYDEARGHPTAADIALIVEVADSSLDEDRAIKGPMYAAAGVPIYWIINLVDKVIEVYTDPSGPTPQPGYATQVNYPSGTDIPLVIAGQQVALIPAQELLP